MKRNRREYFAKYRANRQEYFAKYRAAHRSETLQYLAAYRAAHREFLRRFKSEKGCADCGERDSVVLDFHHLEPGQREHSVSQMVAQSMDAILRELAKCIVL